MMSHLRFLTVHLLGGSLLLLLLTTVCEAEYDSYTPPPSEMENDYNATFDYSFFSNGSTEDLDRFLDEFQEGEEEEEEEENENMSFTIATTSRKNPDGSKEEQEESRRGAADNGASLPISLESRKLLLTAVILIVLNLQQL